MSTHTPPLVAHVIHRLGTGGLENGLVNLINRTPPARYRHAIICLTEAEDFARRITVPDVEILSLHKRHGKDPGLYHRLWRTLRQLRPDILHTRNLSALEAHVPAFLVGGMARVHGEHGRDIYDLEGRNRKYNLLRRVIRPLVQRYITVSRDLERWLQDTIGVPPERIRHIYNGVDSERFHPGERKDLSLPPAGFLREESIVVGTVGRLAEVKDQATLLEAFAELLERRPGIRLIIVGDGPLREHLEKRIRELDIGAAVWMAGDREEVPELLRLMDIFVLPSLGEGISNTILEAQASGLPVVATAVGGNLELIEDGVNGQLVKPRSPTSLAQAIARYLESPELRTSHGREGLAGIHRGFRWEDTVQRYLEVYDELLAQ